MTGGEERRFTWRHNSFSIHQEPSSLWIRDVISYWSCYQTIVLLQDKDQAALQTCLWSQQPKNPKRNGRKYGHFIWLNATLPWHHLTGTSELTSHWLQEGDSLNQFHNQQGLEEGVTGPETLALDDPITAEDQQNGELEGWWTLVSYNASEEDWQKS